VDDILDDILGMISWIKARSGGGAGGCRAGARQAPSQSFSYLFHHRQTPYLLPTSLQRKSKRTWPPIAPSLYARTRWKLMNHHCASEGPVRGVLS